MKNHEIEGKYPVIRGAEALSGQLAKVNGISKFIASAPLKWANTRESLVLEEAAKKYLHMPPDYQDECVTAFRVGGVFVLDAIRATDGLSGNRVVGGVQEDIWEEVRNFFAVDMDVDLGIEDDPPYFPFYCMVTKALRRHEEVKSAVYKIDDVFAERCRNIVGFYATAGAGFVLHQWDLCWDEKCDEIYEDILEIEGGINFNPSRLSW